MKSYTDINQSKMLAEILPIESADMGLYYSHNTLAANNQMWVGTKSENADIPCWSLVALLNILPPYLFEFERGIDLNIYPDLNGKGWHCSYMPNCIENMKTDKFRLITNEDTLVDACYEMIIKLYEQKLL